MPRARVLPQVELIAKTQDALTELISPTFHAIRLWKVTETIPVVDKCPICRRNLGET